MNKFLRYFLILCILYLTFSLIAFPELCIDAGKRAVGLCLDTVIPSLFPFLICSGLFSALGIASFCSRHLSRLMRPLFGIPGSGALALILGIVSGYPTGATCVCDLYRHGDCTKSEAERMLAFCNNSGPLFIIGAVGVGMLGSAKVGHYLYFSHVLSAILAGMLMNILSKDNPSHSKFLPPAIHNDKKNTARTLGSVVDSSVFSMLKICGFILLFSVIGAVIPRFSFTPFIYALLEITGGIKAILSSEATNLPVFPLISFFTAFSGLSVFLQVITIVSPCNLSVAPYLFGKLLQSVLSFIITYLLFSHFPISEDVFLETTAALGCIIEPARLFIASVICGIICAAAVLLLCLFAKILDKLGH